MGTFDDLIPGYFQPDLAKSRLRFAGELDDPNVQSAFNQRIANEVGGQTPDEQQAFVESVMNRALARNQNLSDVVNDRSYFPPQSFRSTGDVDYSPIISKVLLGSNVSKRATGNESGNVRSGGAPVTMAGQGGERFVVENQDTAFPFEDLIPGNQSSRGAFDDLIPKNGTDVKPTYPGPELQQLQSESEAAAPDEEHDLLFYKSGKTKSQREALNKPLREAMQVPAVSPETFSKIVHAAIHTGIASPDDLQPPSVTAGPVEQAITDEIARAASGMTTGEGAITAPLYAFPLTAPGMLAGQAAELPSQLEETARKIREGDYPGAASTGTRAALNAMMIGGVLHGAGELMGGEPAGVGIPSRAEPSVADAIRAQREQSAQAPPETITIYHKTPNQFEVFEPEKATPTGLGGKGVFFNSNAADTAYGDRSIAVTVPKDKILTHAEADKMSELRQGGNLDEIIQSMGYLGVEGPAPGDVILYKPNELIKPQAPAQPEIITPELGSPFQQPEIPPEDLRFTKEGAPPAAEVPTGPAGTSNRQNVVTYGEDVVPGGIGADTTQLLDDARSSIRSGAVDPYSVLSRTRQSGIANPEEYAALAAEHERLVNDAVAKQKAGDPTAPEAVQRATDFANAIQPHKTAASDLFRLMQGDLNYDLGTPFGMDQYMKAELGRGIKPNEAPKFNKMSENIRNGESEATDAVARSDAKVQKAYKGVADIPMAEATARVKQMLKDCL